MGLSLELESDFAAAKVIPATDFAALIFGAGVAEFDIPYSLPG